MNGTAFALDDTDDFSLDEGCEPILTLHEIAAETKARLSAVKSTCNGLAGMSFCELARLHISEPRAATRTALVSMPVATRADAIAATALLKCDGDSDLGERLTEALREFIAAA